MALTPAQRKLLTNLNPGTAKAKLGDAFPKQGVAVPNAAAAPTQAEFNALLASLRAADLIAT